MTRARTRTWRESWLSSVTPRFLAVWVGANTELSMVIVRSWVGEPFHGGVRTSTERCQSDRQRFVLLHSHTLMLCSLTCCRKEKERKASLDLQQKVAQDTRVLAMQKKLEEKKQEQRRLEQIKSRKFKTTEKNTEHAGTCDNVSMKSESKKWLISQL